MRRIWLAMMATVLVIGAGISAHATLRVISARNAARDQAMVAAEARGVSSHVSSTDQETAAPAAGVTGTIDLPDLPIPAGAILDAGVVPARPFSMAGASALDRDRALQCLTAAIYYEAASESDAGQQAVAQVILNRARHPAFPGTVCGVVYQGSEHAGCQFSFACDGALAHMPARAAWVRAARAAGMALAGYVYAPVGLATHYHTYAVTPAWNRALVMTDVVGAHFFHRWKGYWGTSAAFNQRYAGGEPVPGPHMTLPPVAPPTPQMIATAGAAAGAAAVAVPVPVAPVVLAEVKPVSAKPAVPVVTDMLPPESQILDRWKDSGKPLK
ncbi:cell wall hydrolase [Sphingomonas faeni]|uniref:cell wall hydrolase n=1 Tax=Sphingomonas faeni TaxID=185950 RepID=UPI0020BF4506|nr:cell wall hydrolase [Sphingomonas faeni]MCK8456839.1 cell wall hydrolase [Sphingomonas faeni]